MNSNCGSEDFVDGSEEDRLQCLFGLSLYIFRKQTCWSDCFWPEPAMLGDGQSVDVFKLYLLVREIGGYVSTEGLWD